MFSVFLIYNYKSIDFKFKLPNGNLVINKEKNLIQKHFLISLIQKQTHLTKKMKPDTKFNTSIVRY